MISLKSSNGDVFEIEETAAKQSNLIQRMIEDGCVDDVIPLPKVNSKILIKIIDYCKRHAAAENPELSSGSESSWFTDDLDALAAAKDSKPSSESESSSSLSNSKFTDGLDALASAEDSKRSSESDLNQSSSSISNTVDWGDALTKKFSEVRIWRPYVVGEDLQEFDRNFVAVDWDTLMRIMMAANYLEIESLLELTNYAVSGYINKMSFDEIYKVFNIEKDFTPEEEAEIRKEHAWAFI